LIKMSSSASHMRMPLSGSVLRLVGQLDLTVLLMPGEYNVRSKYYFH
jgi:hypothetical protein